MSKRRREGMTPTLFPFLAVLVCTMGTLMLLLTIVTQKAKEQGKADAEALAHAEVETVIEDADWQSDQLQQVRQHHTQELEKRRDQLAHLEDHLQRLNQQLRNLTDQVAAAQDPSEVTAIEADVERLKQKAQSLQTELAKQAAEDEVTRKRPPKVALLPFRGPNGTMRRPIYIECVDDQIIIQPEGIRLPLNALRGPLGPGNPLDAGLRAIRTHYQSIDPEPPYPLLVVRPNGILAYAVARTAMAAWDDQFGYELVPAEVELAFQPPDPRLKDSMQKAIAEAVQRRNTMMAAMPGRFRDDEADAVDRIIQSAQQAGRQTAGNPARGASQLQPIEDGDFQPATGSFGDQALRGNGQNGNGGGASGEGIAVNNPELAGGGTASGIGGGFGGAATPPSLNGGSSMNAFGGSSAMASSTNATSSRSSGGDRLSGGSGNQASGNTATGNTATGSARGASNDIAMSGPGGGSSMMSVGSSNDQMDPGNAKNQNNAATKSSSATSANGGKASTSQPLSRSRGKNWALPENARTQGPAVVRKIHVRCFPDRYEILNPTGQPTRFVIDSAKPDAAVVAMTTNIRQRVEGWGAALAGGRWEPTLVVEVMSDGQAAYDDMRRLLEGSGLVVNIRTAL